MFSMVYKGVGEAKNIMAYCFVTNIIGADREITRRTTTQ